MEPRQVFHPLRGRAGTHFGSSRALAERSDEVLGNRDPDQRAILRVLRKRSFEGNVVLLVVLGNQQMIAGGNELNSANQLMEGVMAALAAARPVGGPRSRLSCIGARPSPPPAELTECERSVLRLMAEGLTKKEIAAQSEISIHTVSSHLRSIYEKLEVTTNTGAVAKALREGLI